MIGLMMTGRRRKKEPKPLVCYYHTPWLDHFAPPIGTGRGCAECDAKQEFEQELVDDHQRDERHDHPQRAEEKP
jgi:hypothetical protein